MSLELVPIDLDEAVAFVARHHRHHLPPVGGKFAIGAAAGGGGGIVGVAIVGRTVARGAHDTWTAEVTRVATDGTRNACSFLYAACWRAARAMGYRRLITYTHKDESGASLRAAGWRVVGEVTARSWDCRSRPRVDKHPLQERWRWEVTA